jgi:hypothetical protein
MPLSAGTVGRRLGGNLKLACLQQQRSGTTSRDKYEYAPAFGNIALLMNICWNTPTSDDVDFVSAKTSNTFVAHAIANRGTRQKGPATSDPCCILAIFVTASGLKRPITILRGQLKSQGCSSLHDLETIRVQGITPLQAPMASLLGILGVSWQATGHLRDSESTQASCAAPGQAEAFRCDALRRLKIALSLDSVANRAKHESSKKQFREPCTNRHCVSQLAEFSQPGMGQILLAPT